MTDQALSLESLVGLEFSHYRILEEIGRGGMGVVYRAHDQHLDREVAIKVLPTGTITDEAARKHLRKEALALSKLNHPNIATVHDFDTYRDMDFLVMEYIPGITLSEKLAGGSLPEKEALRLGVQLAEGLSAAHEHGVVHRDLKPGNLRLTADGRLKVLDFGLAKLRRPVTDNVTTDTLSETQTMAGTLPYMAPEQLSGEGVDARTDIHGAGFVLYEMATGQRPFAEVQGGQLLGALMRKPPIQPTMLNPRLSAELERIIGKCVEKDPENRYQSAKELAIDLRRLLTPRAVEVAEAPVAPRKLWKVLVAAAVLLVAAAIGGTLYLRLGGFGLAYRHFRAAPPIEPPVVLLADFENQTSEKLFDQTVTGAMRQALEQSRFVRLLSQTQAHEAAARMSLRAETRMDSALGREICLRENCRALLTGRIVPATRGYEIIVQLVDPQRETTVRTESAHLANPAALYGAVDGLAKRLREHLGESLGHIEQQSVPLANVTTPSLEALQRYSLAMERLATGDLERFVSLAKSAISLDPDFAMAHLYLARAYSSLGDRVDARQHLTEARKGLARVTERERYLILAVDYEEQGAYDKAAEQYRLLTEISPNDPAAFRGLAGAYTSERRLKEAVLAEQHALKLDPYSAIDYQRLILALDRDNRFQEALDSYKAARAAAVNSPSLLWGCGLAHLGAGDPQAAREDFELMRAQNKPYEVNLASLYLARVLMYEGRLREAADELRTGLVLDVTNRSQSWDPVREYLLAGVEYTRGRTPEAGAGAGRLAASAHVSLQGAELLRAGLIGARLGNLDTARGLLAVLDQLRAQQESKITQAYFYNLLGVVDHISGRNSGAVENLRKSWAFFPSYEAQAALGDAFAAAHEWREAAQAYEAYLEFKGEIFHDDSPSDWVLMHLSLARTYARMGDLDQSRHYYDEFLHLWAHADDDLPALRQARTERARLGDTIYGPGSAKKDISRH